MLRHAEASLLAGGAAALHTVAPPIIGVIEEALSVRARATRGGGGGGGSSGASEKQPHPSGDAQDDNDGATGEGAALLLADGDFPSG